MRHTIIAVLLLAALAGTAVAGPSEDPFSAYERGDYATALRLLRPLAEQGDAGAQHTFGFMYANGQGVRQDYAEAVKWYRLAASSHAVQWRSHHGPTRRSQPGNRPTPAAQTRAQGQW